MLCVYLPLVVCFNLLYPFTKLSLCFHVRFDFAMHHESFYCPFKDSEKMITYVIKTFCAVNEMKTEIKIYIYIYIHIFPRIPYFGLCYFPFDSTQFVRFRLQNFDLPNFYTFQLFAKIVLPKGVLFFLRTHWIAIIVGANRYLPCNTELFSIILLLYKLYSLKKETSKLF